jgi:UTP--glucose-1-phosphate uridylyltransferase
MLTQHPNERRTHLNLAKLADSGSDGMLKQEVPRAVIPAAGLGTRLLPATKEQPKEMLAVFSKGIDGEPSLKPVVQLIFDQLYDCGVREFCFVVGRGKRAIEDHFTPDTEFVALLKARGKNAQAREMGEFYERVSNSRILWVNQPEPNGFGDAVLRAESFAQGEPFLVQAGDNHIISPGNAHLKRLLRARASGRADATLLLKKVADPRQYGVAETTKSSNELIVNRLVEKPSKPLSRLAIVPTYLFEPELLDVLRETKPGKGGEIQLTDAIQGMIDRGSKVNAVELSRSELWLDVGTPETYWAAFRMSRAFFAGKS